MRAVGSSSAWTKGDRKARRQLEKSLKSDENDDVTRFALVRLLAYNADPVAAEVSRLKLVLVYNCACLVFARLGNCCTAIE